LVITIKKQIRINQRKINKRRRIMKRKRNKNKIMNNGDQIKK